MDALLAAVPPKAGRNIQDMIDAVPEKKIKTPGLFGTSLGENTEWMSLLRTPANMARTGLGKVVDKIVPPQTPNSMILSNQDVTRNVLRTGLDVGAEFTASYADPETAVVAGLGKMVTPILQSPIVKKGVEKVAAKIPDYLKRPVIYRFGQPEAYVEAAEGRINTIQKGAEKAKELGKNLSDGLSKAEQIRLGQIVKGGVSVSQREAPLRAAAGPAREELTRLGKQAVDEGLLSNETFLKNVETYMPRTYRKWEKKGYFQSPMAQGAKAKLDSTKLKEFDDAYSKTATPGEAVETQFIRNNLDQFEETYKAAAKKEMNTQRANLVSADLPKTMDVQGRAKFTPELSGPRHEGSSAFAKTYYKKLLNDPDTKHLDVAISAGLSGAGKTSGLKLAGPKLDDYAAIYDTNLSNFKSGQKIIDQALESNPTRNVSVFYTERDPITSFIDGVYYRFKTHPERRIVPIDAYISTMESKATVKKLAEYYARNPKVKFRFIDNTGKKGSAKVVAIDKLPEWKYTKAEVKERLNAFIEQKVATGEITESQAKAFTLSGRNGSGDLRRISQGSGSPESASLSPSNPQLEPKLKTSPFSSPGISMPAEGSSFATSPIKQFGSKPIRIIGQRFKQRGDIPEDVRTAMGEIKEPAYPVARGVAQLTHDVETAKLFNNVSKNPEWSSSVPKGDFVQISGTSKKLGSLSGKYVHPEIARDINDIVRVKGTAEKVYGDLLSKWKFGKVVLNPATHSRNMMSNSIMLDLSGVDLVSQPRILSKSLSELRSKGAYYKEAKDANLLGSEFVGGEIGKLLDNFEKPAETTFGKLLNVVRETGDKVGDIYQAEDQWFKLAKFISEREKGATVKEAAKEAEKWLFNYSKVSPAVDKLRKSPLGMPFITFTAKAAPRVLETAVKNPLRLYKYKMLFNAIEKIAQEKTGITDQEIKTIKRNSRGQVVVLPFRDDAGNPQTVDLSYILPWGDIGETGGFAKLPPALTPGGIVKPLIEAGANKSLYKSTYNPFNQRKAQIYLESDTVGEKTKKVVDYIYKAYAPSFAPGGYSFNKVKSAVNKEPDYHERVRSVATVLADTILGIKINPAVASEMSKFEKILLKSERDEILSSVRSQVRDPRLSADQKTEVRRRAREKIERLILQRSELESE